MLKIRNIFYLILVFFMVAAVFAANNIYAAESDINAPWPAFHHCISEHRGPHTQSVEWTFPGLGETYSSPVVGRDSTIYIGSPNGKIHAVNPDGTLKWTYDTGRIMRSSAALAPDDTIYIGSCDKNIYAINPDGSLKWKYTTDSEVHNSPVVTSDGNTYTGSGDILYVLTADGTLKGSFQASGVISSSVKIGKDGIIYFGSSNENRLYALNPDLSLKWRTEMHSNVINTVPALSNDQNTVYYGSDDGYFYARNTSDGSLKWKISSYGGIQSSAAVGKDGTIYVGTQYGNLLAINPDGTTRWDRYTTLSAYASPAIDCDGVIYYATTYGYIFAMNPNGTVRWSECISNDAHFYSSPAIGSNGSLYITSTAGNLYSVTSLLTPAIDTNTQKLIRDDKFRLRLSLDGARISDKTNSVTFELEYDGNSFELLTGDVNKDVLNGYIPFNMKKDSGSDSTRKITISYFDLDNDVALKEMENILTVNFKVKDGCEFGKKEFRLNPVVMLDSDGNVYNVNNDNPVTISVEVVNAAVVEGFVNIFLGHHGTDLNNAILEKTNRTLINETFKNLRFSAKHDMSDPGTLFNGIDVFLPDRDGNLALVDANGRITGQFRLFTTDAATTIMKIDGSGYISRNINLTLVMDKVFSVSTESAPIEVYPGDVAQINTSRQLILTPDSKIDAADFTGWLKIFKSIKAGYVNTDDKFRSDFTKDGMVDSTDFSLWLASFDKYSTW
jgi:outer membrane protein assembly factor BamB